MANINSINGNPIVLGMNNLDDSVTEPLRSFLGNPYTVPLFPTFRFAGSTDFTSGRYSYTSLRFSVYGGIALMGASAIDILCGSGYQIAAAFCRYYDSNYENMGYIVPAGSYTTDSFFNVVVPDGATHLLVMAKKPDDSAFTSDEIKNADILTVKLRGNDERYISQYEGVDSAKPKHWGFYQFNAGQKQMFQAARLTAETIYEVGDNKELRISLKSGYLCAVNFFDSDRNLLGNTGTWIQYTQTIPLDNYYYDDTAYFAITCRRADGNAISLDETDCIDFDVSSVKTTLPVLATQDLQTIESYKFDSSDIAVYNGNVFHAYTNNSLWLDGTEIPNAALGHGNNMMFGTELDGTFPRLYAGSWYQGDKNVYVNRITNSTAEHIETITYDELPTGYLNMCVDEPNERVYIFMETGADTYQGNILFAVGDFDGNIITSKPLGITIPIVQGMDFVDGHCYLTSGNGTAQYPNLLYVFDIDGNMLSKARVNTWGEIEGVSIDIDGTAYIKCIKLLQKVV